MKLVADEISRDGHGWGAFWPGARNKRKAANGTGPCQEELLEDWSASLDPLQNQRYLLAHAPTGIGKTVSSLVPALWWVAQAPDRRRIYYLVNRAAQHDNPIRELKNHLAPLFEQRTGRHLRVADIVGRQQFCVQPNSPALSGSCKDAFLTATWEDLPTRVMSWREVDAHLKRTGSFCPYHALQKLMASAHVVICDYWWLFSRSAQRNGMTERAGFSPRDSIVIVDEAHNLPIRVRDELCIDEYTEIIETAIADAPELVRQPMLGVTSAVKDLPPNVGISPSELLGIFGGRENAEVALGVLESAEQRLEEKEDSLPVRMLRLLLEPDDQVVIYQQTPLDERQKLVFRVVDATQVMSEGYKRAYAVLCMSGTLAAPADKSTELPYQLPIFGLPPDKTLARVYASPFPLRNQVWVCAADTYGTAQHRNEYLDTYASHILSVGRETPGVTAVFFSSYSFLERVRAKIVDPFEKTLIVAEESAKPDEPPIARWSAGTDEEKLRELVKSHRRAYLFAIYKGKIAEGADFSDNLIKSVICISLPLEYPGLYHKRLQSLYEREFAPLALEPHDNVKEKAKEYAWHRGSLSLVLQACGRGIRSERDRCAFVLLDKRYCDDQRIGGYEWRRFLSPPPFNLITPAIPVGSLHRCTVAAVSSAAWEDVLLRVYR
ncbi:hypothetical protein KSC_002630 [Ktedonobacter sp. SOSP1-52]|uniref:helicase C-terminal domain-containing protein n=1 Tax=Ktedonobacter sp. SOSP1-52 TaxID=2778366 RepID=UPI00191543D0|nr:helicase C-terminal domain-containing protein [Ktedonobacter sp. SOSP1-52]GHO61371.1 hypothetical protein KSC_002630 [Ktedonobacter sp. SOSP1-52]